MGRAPAWLLSHSPALSGRTSLRMVVDVTPAAVTGPYCGPLRQGRGWARCGPGPPSLCMAICQSPSLTATRLRLGQQFPVPSIN